MKFPLRVLVIEDSEDDALICVRELEKGGYEVSHKRVDNYDAMEHTLDEQPWDIVLADYSMPKFSGAAALKLLQNKGIDIPFILVSGLAGEDAVITAMKEGAHDYIPKNSLVRLVPAVKREMEEMIVRRRRRQVEEELRKSLDKLKRITEETITALATTVEIKDPYTAGHQKRVAKLASEIAGQMGLSVEDVDGVRISGLLHDIGKIAIPAEILSKPGKITVDEYNLIKTHPEIGYQILKGIEFSWPVANTVLQHHERMDGSGYPRGASGESIDIGARILGVADVVEAMSSHRPYRPAFGIDKALDEIIVNASKLYDERVVGACVTLFRKHGFKFD